jgi:hypothetical protein
MSSGIQNSSYGSPRTRRRDGGAGFADLHRARRHRLDHFAAAAELLPVDL